MVRANVKQQVEKEELPEALRPYEFLGLDFSFRKGDREATCDCPWCGRSDKFRTNIQSGLWQCMVCREGTDKGGGGIGVFLQKLWEKSFEATEPDAYQRLAEDRQLHSAETLVSWHLSKSILTDNWLIPGFNAEGKLTGLYQYVFNGERKLLMPTPTLKHHLLGRNLYDADKGAVYLAEGIWDAMALWEVLGKAKQTDNGLAATGNESGSLLADANVLAVPGANVFYDSWLPLFEDKAVRLWGQNDHPRTNENNQDIIPGASYTGMRRIVGMLANSAGPPASMKWLKWGDDLGHNPELKHGHDLRDTITAAP